jgi:Leucine-rich repeat (LRR) protein
MCRWEERAFPALLAGLSGGSIAQLFLRSNGLDDTSAAALAAADLPALRTLDLSNNQLTNVGLAALLEAPWITQLEVLDISNCLVDADMRQRAAASGVSLKRIG